jgi:hypothetical protein
MKDADMRSVIGLIGIAFLITLGSSQARSNTPQSHPSTSAFSTHGIKALTVEEFYPMMLRICHVMSFYRNDESYDIKKASESILFEYSDIDPDGVDSQRKLVEFWNHYVLGMICPSASNLFDQKHLYKRIIELGVHRGALTKYFLRDNIEFPVDMNAVEIGKDGKPTTILDYLDEILTTPELRRIYNAGRLMRLRRLIVVRFDGKRADEMSAQELERRVERFHSLKKLRR